MYVLCNAFAFLSTIRFQIAFRLRAALRLLQCASEHLAPLLDGAALFSTLSHDDACIRWLSAQCLALMYGLARVDARVDAELAARLALAEQHDLIQLQPSLLVNDTSSASDSLAVKSTGKPILVTGADLSPALVDVCGFPVIRNFDSSVDASVATQATAGAAQVPQSTFVYTPTVRQNMSALALALARRMPVWLEGESGSGKTALIHELARLTHNDIIKVHLGEQTDPKALLGTYVCTEVPGEFRWIAGALTQAVRDGRWIVIEDIDLAPLEVLSVLMPLLEQRKLFVAERGETIAAASGFQMFATRTIEAGSHAPCKADIEAVAGLWSKTAIAPLPSAEVVTLLSARFPALRAAHAVQSFVDTFNAVLRASPGATAALGVPPLVDPSAADAPGATARVSALLTGAAKPLSLRDLIKWCQRCEPVVASHSNSVDTIDVRDTLFLEALDCFVGMLPDGEDKSRVALLLGDRLGLARARVEHFTTLNKPIAVFDDASTAVRFGRSTLPRTAASRVAAGTRGLGEFAMTTTALKLLEQVAVCVERNEPALLVGETGAGKTTTVQFLADAVGRQLVVMNLNQQTETSDLLGGFKPVDLRTLCAPLRTAAERLFPLTFSRTENAAVLDTLRRCYAEQKWTKFIQLLRRILDKTEALFVARERRAAAADGGDAGDDNNNADEQQQQSDSATSKRRRTAEAASSASGAGSKRALAGDAASKKRARVRAAAAAAAAAVADAADVADPGGAAAPDVSVTSLRGEWRALAEQLTAFEVRRDAVRNSFAFSFAEGAVVQALRDGAWLLLDEINLAPAETLEALSPLLEGESVTLLEAGELQPVPRHANFRLFACMNPPTDVGKRPLPPGVRSRFTELRCAEPSSDSDLALLVGTYLRNAASAAPIERIVALYREARRLAAAELSDGAGQRPHYSLRSLSRALDFARVSSAAYGLERALFDGFSMSFVTQLEGASEEQLRRVVASHIGGGVNGGAAEMLSRMRQLPKRRPQASEGLVPLHGFYVRQGALEPIDPPHYVLTPTVLAHVANLARVLVSRRHPVLLQGPTSSGKTSLVEYLAMRTGHRFVRINNHEHTDLEQYMGGYASDQDGRLVFREGALVTAVRRGDWIVLDELNLAPSDVLEALNRLLDDNRELFLPETQETLTPHPEFMLFATQNPPGLYGGRKVLSRAFRNRFLEFHVGDIPDDELQTIVEKRCQLPTTFTKRMIGAVVDLRRHRHASGAFSGRRGVVTFRDLFRWAQRRPGSQEELAAHGYMLLAERLRRDDERAVVREVIERRMKVTLDLETLYYGVTQAAAQVPAAAATTTPDAAVLDSAHSAALLGALRAVADASDEPALRGVVWTRPLCRVLVLVARCLAFSEPVLLVGETGTGKTTACQLFATLRSQRLHIVNCHQHTETADFIGGLRPTRNKDVLRAQFAEAHAQFAAAASSDALPPLPAADAPSVDDIDAAWSAAQQFVGELRAEGRAAAGRKRGATAPRPSSSRRSAAAPPSLSPAQQAAIDASYRALKLARGALVSLFQWYDGPLIEAMRNGDMLLIDEVSLADDAVLERLNSVLEPARQLVLAERSGVDAEALTAHADFRLLATMNPGGDYGKKELSPAMRNRFTEIWVPANESRDDLRQIALARVAAAAAASSEPAQCAALARSVLEPLLDFVDWFRARVPRRTVTLRDVLALVQFVAVSVSASARSPLAPGAALVHGARLVLLDGLGSMGGGLPPSAAASAIADAMARLHALLGAALGAAAADEALAHADPIVDEVQRADVPEPWPLEPTDGGQFGIAPFRIACGGAPPEAQSLESPFTLGAPTTWLNARRVLRAMQLSRPILLEGSPGIGKTGLVVALARASGHRVVRINLSEQTDIMDLLGAELPIEGGAAGHFEWRDGALLQALKAGDWVLLDEMNLASQSVLEGLNACLDHRATVFVPELGRSFACPPSFRVFACQNPTSQGGGRKGLPKSFVNRFAQVHVAPLGAADLRLILTHSFPAIAAPTLRCMVQFGAAVVARLESDPLFLRRGRPWQFNLRDMTRWCELLAQKQAPFAAARRRGTRPTSSTASTCSACAATAIGARCWRCLRRRLTCRSPTSRRASAGASACT
jgi:midasin